MAEGWRNLLAEQTPERDTFATWLRRFLSVHPYTGGGTLAPDWMMDRGVVERRKHLRELSQLSHGLEPIAPLDIKHGMDDRESSNIEDRRIKGSFPEEYAPLVRLWDEARRKRMMEGHGQPLMRNVLADEQF